MTSEALQIALMGPKAMDAQRQFGNRQMLEGTSGAPVRHWTQAANRALQGAVGGLRESQVRSNEEKISQLQKEALMQALNGGDLSASAQMLMGNPGTADMGAQLATTAISQRQAAANRAASEQAKLAAEQRAHERAKELIQMRLQAQGGGSASYGKSGAIVQGPGGRFFSVQFADDGTRKIMPLTFEEAQAQGVLGDGFAGIPGSADGGSQPAPSQAQAVPLSPAKGVSEVDTGTGTLLIDRATGQPINEIAKNLGEAEKQKVVGRAEGEKVANAPKAAATLRSLERQWSLVDDTITKSLGDINWSNVGFVGDWAKVIPGTPAYNLKETLETIRANIGFDKLQDMRDNSPTGGALGQVSEFENRLLQSVRGSLQQGQSAEQLRGNLARVQQDLRALQQERRQAFEQTYGGGVQQSAPQPQPQSKTLVFDPATGELRPK